MKLAAILPIALATLATSDKFPDGAIGYAHETEGDAASKNFWLFDSSFKDYNCLHFEPNGVATQNLDPNYRCRYYTGGDCVKGLIGGGEGLKGIPYESYWKNGNQTLGGQAHSATCWFAGP